MNDAMAKGLEGALKAAVDPDGAAGSDNGNGAGTTNDLVSLAIKVLPKLLENSEGREEHVELESEDVLALRKEMRLLRRLLHALVKSHEGILEELALMRELQSTLVSQMGRLQILEVPDDEEIDYAFDDYPDANDYADDLFAPPKRRGGGSHGSKRIKKNGRRIPRSRLS